MPCEHCGYTGRIQEIKDENYFDTLFDRYAGQFDMETARRKALDKVGYTYVPCPYCQTNEETDAL
jgi:hypothetical protein